MRVVWELRGTPVEASRALADRRGGGSHHDGLAASDQGLRPVPIRAWIDPLRVEVVLLAQACGRFKVRMFGEVSPEGFSGKFPPTVTVIDPVLDAALGTFRLRL